MAEIVHHSAEYLKKMEDAWEFQDYVSDVCRQNGIILNNYQSRKWQLKHGENMLGAEIKFDQRFRETGNLFLETHERVHETGDELVESGISRWETSWLYIIGDYADIWIFPTRYLHIWAVEKAIWGEPVPIRNQRGQQTGYGRKMPLVEAEKKHIRHFHNDAYAAGIERDYAAVSGG